MGFLTEAVERVRRELERNPPSDDGSLRRADAMPPPKNFEAALRVPGISLIAEVKRASPSAGAIADAEPGAQAELYEKGGAAAVSVLTEQHYFDGSMADLRAVRLRTSLPVLRKDFIVQPAQVLDARIGGADAVLLIAAALSDSELHDLRDVAEGFGMGVLVETHSYEEVERAVAASAKMIGVNARDLETLEVDVEGALEIVAAAPRDRVIVLESGVSSREQITRAREAGADAVLVGEALMRAPDPAALIRELIEA